jgi:hypothetical protein
MGEATSLLKLTTTRTRSTPPDIRREKPAANTVKEWFKVVGVFMRLPGGPLHQAA